MQKWMIFCRDSDGVHFLWNGEHPIRISPSTADITEQWHHSPGSMPETQIALLNKVLQSRKWVFSILGRGRYQVLARGYFKE